MSAVAVPAPGETWLDMPNSRFARAQYRVVIERVEDGYVSYRAKRGRVVWSKPIASFIERFGRCRWPLAKLRLTAGRAVLPLTNSLSPG